MQGYRTGRKQQITMTKYLSNVCEFCRERSTVYRCERQTGPDLLCGKFCCPVCHRIKEKRVYCPGCQEEIGLGKQHNPVDPACLCSVCRKARWNCREARDRQKRRKEDGVLVFKPRVQEVGIDAVPQWRYLRSRIEPGFWEQTVEALMESRTGAIKVEYVGKARVAEGVYKAARKLGYGGLVGVRGWVDGVYLVRKGPRKIIIKEEE